MRRTMTGRELSAVAVLALAAGASAGSRYYLHSTRGDAWNQRGNEDAMDVEFGPGHWIEGRFETIDVNAVFSPDTDLVFIDGSAGNDTNFRKFVESHHDVLENWVAAGGGLFLNAAGWYEDQIDTGFGPPSATAYEH